MSVQCDQPMPWTEANIARAIAIQTFNRRYLVAVPNCTWTGHECDLLVVTENLRIIDVEVKISRSDLKADAKKEKWWQRHVEASGIGWERLDPPQRRTHPPKVWKHYYAVPKEIWTPDLLDSLPSPASGLLLLHRDGDGYPRRNGRPEITVSCARRATPNREAKPISAEAAIDIARLASLRMWNTYQALEDERAKAAA